MIKGMHGMFYSSKADDLRAFLKDKLKLSFTDTGGGWLIFDFDSADLGVHPTQMEGKDALDGTHNISFFTDDVRGTVAELESRGVKFDDEITDAGYGLITHFTMPGGAQVQLYQPKYTKKVRRAQG